LRFVGAVMLGKRAISIHLIKQELPYLTNPAVA
jgi:hypothetical protein